MMLADVRDYIDSLGIAEHVYMGKLPDKEDKSVGVYNSKHQNVYLELKHLHDFQAHDTARLHKSIRNCEQISKDRKQSGILHLTICRKR